MLKKERSRDNPVVPLPLDLELDKLYLAAFRKTVLAPLLFGVYVNDLPGKLEITLNNNNNTTNTTTNKNNSSSNNSSNNNNKNKNRQTLMGESNNGGSDIIITIGLCAMAKKAMSKPMKEILRRMDKFQHIRLIIFEEHVILNEPIESWPICDALVSFYSEGFPLEKAIAYSNLRKPYLVNDLESQYILMDRRLVYECLKREGVPVPRYACVSRRPGSPPVNVVESDDSIEIEGQIFHKPFVEKPLSAEDHNVYIYFPSSAGGGSQRLFRKVGNLSSKYFSHSNIRTNGSYMYEEFMPTDGTDVKVYTVADDYAHAEARKSPALDGKVERDHEGKEVRYPVILTPREKIIAKKVAKAVQQQICGFDLLRANGMSYVCDVNGFSFVKSSRKYYDDCSHILGVLITRKIAPRLCVPAHLPPGTDVDTPWVPTTCGTIMELRCVIAVIRHGDRTPKQKMKMEVRHEKFFCLFSKYAGEYTHELKLKRPTQLQEVLDIVRFILEELESSDNVDPQLKKNRPKFEQLKYVLEMYGSFSGINRKIQLKYHPCDVSKGMKTTELSDQMASSYAVDSPPSLLLVVKWGGELTAAGKQQAETLGRAFRCIYPGGDGHYGKDPGLGLLRLHSTYRHDLKIYASDEGRVQMTAAAFAKGFLALEGELPPILVQMVKSANTNGLLDNDNDCRHYQHIVKHRIKEVMSKASDFTDNDIEMLVPTGAKSIVNSMRYVGNPRAACDRLFGYVKRLGARLLKLATSQKTRNAIKLYQGESWELLLRRWGKLWKDFRGAGEEYDLSKISDIYDNIKYDLQHNSAILVGVEAQDFFMCAKSLADIIVPQEYGITVDEKLVIGQRICTPLMRKILSDARYTDVDECTRLHAGYSKGVASPERFVRTRLYFTSESHLHSLLTCLRYGDLADVMSDQQWRRAMDYVSSVSEINYLAQIVIMIYEDPTVEPKTEKRFHVELHFSPGAFALCHDLPEGTGFRPGKLERLNSQASVLSSAASGGKGSSDSVVQPPTHCASCLGHTSDSNSRDAHSSAASTPCKAHLDDADSASIAAQNFKRPPCPSEFVTSDASCVRNTDLDAPPMETVTTRSVDRASLTNLYSEKDGSGTAAFQKLTDGLQPLKFWRDSVMLTSTMCTTGTTTTTGSVSDAGEDDDIAVPSPATLGQESASKASNSVDINTLISGHLNLTTDRECNWLPRPNPVISASAIVTGLSQSNLENKNKSVGIGRFLITRSIADHDVKLSPLHTKSAVTLPSDAGVFFDPTSINAEFSQVPGWVEKLQPLSAVGSHFGRSKLLDSRSNTRLTVSCSPDRHRCTLDAGKAPLVPTEASLANSAEANSRLPVLKHVHNWHCESPALSLYPSVGAQSNGKRLTNWIVDQAESTVRASRPVDSMNQAPLFGPQDLRAHFRERTRSQPRPVSSGLQPTSPDASGLFDSSLPPSPSAHRDPTRLLDPFESFYLSQRDFVTDDLSILKLGGLKRIHRRHSTGSLFPMFRNLGLSTVSYRPTKTACHHNLSVTSASGSAVGQHVPDATNYVPSSTDLNTHCSPPGSGNTMCDAMMAYVSTLEERNGNDPTNQTLNALTYPSHQNPYSLDIERLVRAVALGAPMPRPFCRSLISTAVIRGSKDDGQGSSSVPDITRLTDDPNLAPRTLTPGSSNDFFVPSAPCVPEVYPLETLHNALTLSQLEAFFARLTTHKFPTPFTSPQHPSTPVSYCDRHHHTHRNHDSDTNLVEVLPVAMGRHPNYELSDGSPLGAIRETGSITVPLNSTLSAPLPFRSSASFMVGHLSLTSRSEDCSGTYSEAVEDNFRHSDEAKTPSISSEDPGTSKSE